MKNVKEQFEVAANVNPNKNAVLYFPIECDYGSMPNNIMISINGNADGLYLETEVVEEESSNWFPNKTTYFRIFNDDNEFFCAVVEDWDTEQTKFILIDDGGWYALNYGKWIKTFIKESKRMGIFNGSDNTFKINTKREDLMDVLNGAIACACFDKKDVAIGIYKDEVQVLEDATEEDIKGRVGYLIKASEYKGVVIPEGGDAENKDGMNSFQQWLVKELTKHSNAMYDTFLKEGYDLNDKFA